MKTIAVDEKYMPDENTPLLNSLLDPDDKEPIPLKTSEGEDVFFEQLATIPYEGKIYCLLHPTQAVDGVAEDECIVFVYDRDGDAELLFVEEDDAICAAVYDEYLELLGEGEGAEQ